MRIQSIAWLWKALSGDKDTWVGMYVSSFTVGKNDSLICSYVCPLLPAPSPLLHLWLTKLSSLFSLVAAVFHCSLFASGLVRFLRSWSTKGLVLMKFRRKLVFCLIFLTERVAQLINIFVLWDAVFFGSWRVDGSLKKLEAAEQRPKKWNAIFCSLQNEGCS